MKTLNIFKIGPGFPMQGTIQLSFTCVSFAVFCSKACCLLFPGWSFLAVLCVLSLFLPTEADFLVCYAGSNTTGTNIFETDTNIASTLGYLKFMNFNAIFFGEFYSAEFITCT
jgi:hypothetical protein